MSAILVAQLQLLMSPSAFILSEGHSWVRISELKQQVEDVKATEDPNVEVDSHEDKF
jgi:hypothetical protein